MKTNSTPTWLSTLIRNHGRPLALVLIATAIGQIAMLIQHPFWVTSWDSLSYITEGQQILTGAIHLVQPFRTPGYPLLLASVTWLTGGIHPSAMVAAQMLVGTLTIFEVYVLVFRITGNRWTAATAASVLALNIYIQAWERILYTESLSYWSIVTLFLAFEWFARAPRIRTATVFGLAGFIAIMVRPAMVLFAFALIAMLLLWSMRSGRFFRLLPLGVLALAVIYVPVYGYMAINRAANGFFGLTMDHNITLYGKVEEYGMQALPVDPKYAQVQADTIKYVEYVQHEQQAGVPDPWTFPFKFPNRYYSGSFYSQMGGYAEDVIKRHPLPYIEGGLHDVIVTWLTPPVMYSVFNAAPDGKVPVDNSVIPGFTGYAVSRYGTTGTQYEPWWVNLLLVFSTLVQFVYFALPVLLVVALVRVWRHPQNIRRLIEALLLTGVVYMIFVDAFANYSEWYRIRFPVDWAMIAVAIVMVWDGFTWLRGKRQGKDTAREMAALSSGTVVGDSTSLLMGDTEILPRTTHVMQPPDGNIEISIVLP